MYFIVFANSLDLDQVWQNIEPDLDLNWHLKIFRKRILKTIIFKLNQQTSKPNENYPAWKALAQYIFFCELCI